MRKFLLGAVIAILALAAGPPAVAQSSPTLQSYQVPVITGVLAPTDAAYQVRAVYHPVHETAIDMKVNLAEKNAGKKKASDSKEEVAKRERRAAAPAYPLLL